MRCSLVILAAALFSVDAFQLRSSLRRSVAPTDTVVAPVPCRDDFAIVAQQSFVKTGKAAEIGVFQGNFSKKNLHHWKGQYYMIDAWSHRPSDVGDKNFKNDAINNANMKAAMDNTKFAGDRRHVIQALSFDAAKDFEDNSLDWIYVDALHTYDALMIDLDAWYPKLRPGGLMTGDDYGDMKDTNLVSASRWETTYGGVAKNPANQWGVIRALSDFGAKHKGLDLKVTWMNDCYAYNAWYFVKPQ